MLGEMSIYAHIFVLCFFREGFCYDVCSGAGNWSFYDRQCYSCIADSVSWPTARTSCQQLGADLVTISNAGIQSFLEESCPYRSLWIGLNDLYNENNFTWIGNSTILLKESYSNWKQYEPNDKDDEDCVVMDIWDQNKWNDLNCSANRSYICQKPQLQGDSCDNFEGKRKEGKPLQEEELLGGYAILAISVLSLLLVSTWLIVAVFAIYKKRHGNLHQSNTRDTHGIRLGTQSFTGNHENFQISYAREMYTELGNPYQGSHNTNYEELKM